MKRYINVSLQRFLNMKSIIKLNGKQIDYKIYSDGSVGVTIPTDLLVIKDNILSCYLLDSQGIFAMFQILEYMLEEDKTLLLNLDYLPFARQDRFQIVDNTYIPNSFKSFVRTLSVYKDVIQNVALLDPHSDLNIKIFEHFGLKTFIIPQHSLLDTIVNSFPTNINYVIAPDKGARNKSKHIAEQLHVSLLTANKTRNPLSHEIELSFDTTVDLTNTTVLISDDIIDYGTSIHELTKKLKETYKGITILVFISHAILPLNTRLEIPSRFSYALQYVDMFNCYNLLPDNSEPSDVDIPINAFNIL